MATDENGYTEIANKDHIRTYSGFLGLTKWLIVFVALVLLFLLAVCKG